MKKSKGLTVGALLLGFAGFILVTQPRPYPTNGLANLVPDPDNGQWVFTAAGCASCHMADGATVMKSWLWSAVRSFLRRLEPFSPRTFPPDPDAGIGGWTTEQFAIAVMDGISPENQHYYPAMAVMLPMAR